MATEEVSGDWEIHVGDRENRHPDPSVERGEVIRDPAPGNQRRLEQRRRTRVSKTGPGRLALTHLLDSVVLIDHFNGLEQAQQYIRMSHGYAAISVITRAEVLAGFDFSPSEAVLKFLDSFPNLALDTTIANLAAELNRENGWKLPDAFQAAFAQHHGLRLATRNIRDFPPEKFQFVEVPYWIKPDKKVAP
jgi:predicted nucleic acid-binding protein